MVFLFSRSSKAVIVNILNWQRGFFVGRRQKGFNKNILLLHNSEFPALPYVISITAISGSCKNINHVMCTISSSGLVGRWFVTTESIQGTTGLCRGKSISIHWTRLPDWNIYLFGQVLVFIFRKKPIIFKK